MRAHVGKLIPHGRNGKAEACLAHNSQLVTQNSQRLGPPLPSALSALHSVRITDIVNDHFIGFHAAKDAARRGAVPVGTTPL